MTLLALIDLENFDIGFEFPSIRWRNLQKRFIVRGYLPQLRSLNRRAEYAERCKLLVMSVLYTLGTGAGFCFLVA